VLSKLNGFFLPKDIGFLTSEFDMDRITLEPGKRGGRPCIRGLRISVYDVLSMLSGGMSQQEVLDDFPELTQEDILAVLGYAADREHQVSSFMVQ
jgi:uncharacterized protein (DUF433 family)